jgi:hypothetical protein
MRPPPPHIIAAHAVQKLSQRHTAAALLSATAARTAAELVHKGQATPESIENAIQCYAILLRAALGSLDRDR